MPDSLVMQRECVVCGASVAKDSAKDLCVPCSKVLGSIAVIPAPTVVRDYSPLPLSPKNFGDFEIVSELARGGMGVVYVARQLSLNRLVALKMILAPFAGPGERRRFRNEAEHAARIEHPNIVPVYECGETEGLPYFTMKLIQGRSFSAELRRTVNQPRIGVSHLAKVARAVHFAHQRGILHRDLKPANILIDVQGVPYVGDFGIAKRVAAADDAPAADEPNGAAALTRRGAVVGTPHYMAPEQARGDSHQLTTAADVYGLGAILYEVLTLRSPFEGGTSAEVIEKVKRENPIPPHKRRAAADRELEAVCLKSLDKDPAKRYGSAEEFARDLERWLNGEPVLARRHSLRERALKWVRRRPAVASSVALAALLMFALAGFYWRSSALLQRAERQKIEERNDASMQASQAGLKALDAARASVANPNSLIEAEDRFRAALAILPANTAAQSGLRDTALLSFQNALQFHDWRQAREKLLLARSAALQTSEFDRLNAQLARLESERGEQLRARVTALMNDACAVVRTVPYEMALYELIAMKDPLTVASLVDYLSHERAECRQLACAALAWTGDASQIKVLLPLIQTTTPAGHENPPAVQEAALNAVCMLAADDDTNAFDAVTRRIASEPDEYNSLLFHRIEPRYRSFVRRQVHRAVAQPADTADDRLRRARLLADSGATREALALYDTLLAGDPDNPNLLLKRGLLRRTVQDLPGALSDFDAVISRHPNDAAGFINRASVLSDMGQAEAGLADLDKAAQIAPNSSTLLSTRGLALMNLGRTNEALRDYDQALKLDPDQLYALTNRGYARAQMKNYIGALADFDRAIALNPTFHKALTGRACTHMELHETDNAIADFDRTLALDPTQFNCFHNRAVLKTSKQDFKGAILDYDRCVQLDSTRAVTFYNRAVARKIVGDLEGAAADYARTLELSPNRVEALVNLGQLRQQSGATDAALELFTRAIALNPKKFEAWTGRARLHAEQGHIDQARQDFLTARTLKPEPGHESSLDDAEQSLKDLDAKKN